MINNQINWTENISALNLNSSVGRKKSDDPHVG